MAWGQVAQPLATQNKEQQAKPQVKARIVTNLAAVYSRLPPGTFPPERHFTKQMNKHDNQNFFS
jgi:hypothetical protein